MGKPIFLNLEVDLFNVVEAHATASQVIAIDGTCGVGKSFLARKLSERFGYVLVGCDAFIHKGSGHLPYPEILEIDRLRESITVATAKRSPVIVESILLRLILDSLGIKDAFHVYVKRRRLDGTVLDAELFDDIRTEDELIAEHNEISRALEDTDGIPYLDSQLVRYHKSKFPHEQSDVLYEVRF